MANKVLWQILDNYTVSSEEFDYDEFGQYLLDVVGPEYEVEFWDADDFSGNEAAEDTIGWVSERCKGKIVEDLQIGTWWAKDQGRECIVVILKTKEVKGA